MVKNEIVEVKKKEKKYSCADCKTFFTKMRNLKSHREIYHNAMLQRFVCNICGKQFTLAYNLSDHYKKIHPMEQLPVKDAFSITYKRNTRSGLFFFFNYMFPRIAFDYLVSPKITCDCLYLTLIWALKCNTK